MNNETHVLHHITPYVHDWNDICEVIKCAISFINSHFRSSGWLSIINLTHGLQAYGMNETDVSGEQNHQGAPSSDRFMVGIYYLFIILIVCLIHDWWLQSTGNMVHSYTFILVLIFQTHCHIVHTHTHCLLCLWFKCLMIVYHHTQHHSA